MADKSAWPRIQEILKMKNPPVPFSTAAEILYAAGNQELVADTVCRVPDKEQRIELLIDYKQWVPAIDEICKAGMHQEYRELVISLAAQDG